MKPIDIKDAKFELYEVCKQQVLFTEERIDRKTAPTELYVYDIRHDDDGKGIPCTIEPKVAANFYGTIICKKPVELTKSKYGDYRNISKRGFKFLKPGITLGQYMNDKEIIK